MSQVRLDRIASPLGEELVATNGKLTVRWESGAQLVLVDPADERTRVAGGMLVELAPAAGERRSRTLGLGIESTSRIVEPQRFADEFGSGFAVSRQYPVAVQPLAVTWTTLLYDDLPVCGVRITLRNVSSEPLTVRRLFPFVAGSWWGSGCLRLGERAREFDAYKNGWQSWSYAGGLPVGRPDPRPRVPTLVAWHSPGGRSPRQPISGRVDVVSEGMGMLGHATAATALLAGFVSQERWFGQVYLDRREGALAACALLDDLSLAPGDEVEAPPLLLALCAEHEALARFTDAVAAEGQPRRSELAPSGWCSWYYYFDKVNEDAIAENLMALRSQRSTLPLDVVQIDDGYQMAVGDWLTVNDSFPHGMGRVAERIRLAGYRPGLWLAPFTVAANSRLAHDHPEWLVHGVGGQPVFAGKNWDTSLYALDTTHPGARVWLRETLETIVRDWGFDYLKLDFLASGAARGQRHDPQATRASALRDGLRLIREIVGDEVFLLACGCPLLSAVGLVDAMRIGPDSAPYWSPRHKGVPIPLSEGHSLPTLEGAVRNTLARAWMHPKLWLNDPDCLLLRDSETELTADEARMFASAVGLTGGMTVLSDRLSRLTLERLEVASKLLPPMRERALPITHFSYGVPECVSVDITRGWGRWTLVGLFNGGPFEREMRADWKELGLAHGNHHAVEFWTQTYLGRSTDGVTLRVPAHGAAVLAVHAERGVPLLLSTTFHISQGGVEIEDWQWRPDTGVLRWEARLGRHVAGTFTIWLPPNLRPRRLASTAPSATWRRNVRGEVVVTADIHDDARFTFELDGEVTLRRTAAT